MAHESVQVRGIGAEVAATVADALIGRLKAAVKRLGSPSVPIAYAPPLEDMLRITPTKIAETAAALFRG